MKTVDMERLDLERVVSELKSKLEDDKSRAEDIIVFVNERLNAVLNAAALQTGGALLTRLKSSLFQSGVLAHCVSLLEPKKAKGNWPAAAALTQLLSSCCVGAEPGDQSEAFNRLFLPSVINALLTLAARLMRQTESLPLFRTVLDSVGWILQTHHRLTAQVLNSVAYEQMQVSEDSAVSLTCVQLWIHTVSSNRDFVNALSDDTVTLLLNDAVSQLAVSSDAVVGGASVRLLLLLADQLKRRFQPLLRIFAGLDHLLDNDWRGRGFDQDVDRLIQTIQSNKSVDHTEHTRAACVIQAAWRSYRTRTRVKNLHRAVSSLQRRYRARRQEQKKQQKERLELEVLRYQTCLQRQQARRKFHLKQRQQLQLLPPELVAQYLKECERRATVLIQSHWRGFRERRRFEQSKAQLQALRKESRAAVTIQRAVRRFLDRRRAARIPPSYFLIGQRDLTDRRRAELKKQVEDYITLHPSQRVSVDECRLLHGDVQQMWITETQAVLQRRRREQRIQALLAHTRTQLNMLREAPPLSLVSQSEAALFLTPVGPVATRARHSHNARLWADRAPWWRILANEASIDRAPSESLEAELDGGL